MDDEGKEVLTETMKTLKHEFDMIHDLLTTYLKDSDPIDPDGKYFRLRFMQQVCDDLLDILKSKEQLDEDMIKGTEMALTIFKKCQKI